MNTGKANSIQFPVYVVKWIETESFQPTLDCKNRAAEAVCKTVDEAFAIYNLELAMTSFKKVSNLDFTTSDSEFKSHVTYLAILTLYDEDTVEEEKASEYYYIND